MTAARRVYLTSQRDGLRKAVYDALAGAGILGQISAGTRVALKPNLTYPYYKCGVTTSPEVIHEVVLVLKDRGARIALVETDGGYGAWTAEEAFAGHHLDVMAQELGFELVNLCGEEQEMISFVSRSRRYALPLPSRLLHHTDVLITLPVPKIHAMAGLTLAYKNQWGCIPEVMRMRRHYIFDAAIVAINQTLRPAVLGDGTYFLDRSGPMEGKPVRMDLIIGATDAGSFDRYVSELMDFPWTRVPHLRHAVRCNDMPAALPTVACNVSPQDARTHTFTLQRSLRNRVALLGFRSRWVTWFGYEFWFGRVVLHAILYSIAGRPVRPQLDEASVDPSAHETRLPATNHRRRR